MLSRQTIKYSRTAFIQIIVFYTERIGPPDYPGPQGCTYKQIGECTKRADYKLYFSQPIPNFGRWITVCRHHAPHNFYLSPFV